MSEDFQARWKESEERLEKAKAAKAKADKECDEAIAAHDVLINERDANPQTNQQAISAYLNGQKKVREQRAKMMKAAQKQLEKSGLKVDDLTPNKAKLKRVEPDAES